jgi:hypothetical protein
VALGQTAGRGESRDNRGDPDTHEWLGTILFATVECIRHGTGARSDVAGLMGVEGRDKRGSELQGGGKGYRRARPGDSENRQGMKNAKKREYDNCR